MAAFVVLIALACGSEDSAERERAAFQRGIANAQANELDAALADLDIALEINPNNPDTIILYAVLQERLEDLDSAAEHLSRATEIDPTNADAPLHLARVLRKRELDSRIDIARQEIINLGAEPARLVAFGDLLRARERFDDAQTHYLWAQRIAPPDAASHTGLGLVYSNVHREVRALYHLSEALRIDPSNAAAREELVWILATSSHADLSDAQEARRIAEAALQSGAARSTRLLDALAAAYAGSDRFEEASQLARSAIAAAQAEGNHIRAHQIRARLRLYEAGKRFVGPPVDPT
ncbi:MAG: tetratricopeptide repeat protein [Myxococcota bacterium]|nr:tetratricopeptide repeat protein [Myxococcota bacterium]